jgi:hypothetical protein
VRKFLKLFTFWSFAILVALQVLEASPEAARLLNGAGAPYVSGWLFHFGLVAMFFEGLIGRCSRLLIAFPTIFYPCYYLAYWQQSVHIAEESKLLKSTNPRKILELDSKQFSVVMDGADTFVAAHAIPVAYTFEPSYRPDQYVSYRLMPDAQVNPFIRAAGKDIQTLGVYWNDAKMPNLREIRMPQKPATRFVTITFTDDPGIGWNDWNIGVETTEVALDRERIGLFKSAYVQRLPKFPFLTIGCVYSGRPAEPNCQASFVFERQTIDSIPDSIDQTRFDDPVSIMLGIPSYTEAELRDFRGYPVNAAGPQRPEAASRPNHDAAFATLRAIVDGQNPPVAWTMSSAVASDPARLAPLASDIAKRFVELNGPEAADLPGRHEQVALLAAGLAALAPADFLTVSGQFDGVVRKEDGWRRYPLLYLRLADRGPSMFSFYRDRFLARDISRSERLLATLAICRIGLADSELLAAMKSGWSNEEPATTGDDDEKTALLVALLKLGQGALLRETARTDSPSLQAWYDAVLDGRGKTNVGPNNCMPMDWPLSEFVPANLASNLRWSRRRWISEEAN